MNNESASTRWWENYLVRYFLPSVVGMVILRWLDINVENSVGNYIPVFLLENWKGFGVAHLITWLLFGFLYCYISAYPILVFHATRVLDFRDRAGNISSFGLNPYFLTVLFTVFAYIAAWLDKLWLAFVLVSIFSGFQLYRLYKAYSRQGLFDFDEGYEASVAYAYLNKLSKRRSIKEEESKTEDDEGNKTEDDEDDTAVTTNSKLSDLAESYKHLREHGSTAFIFLLELALCPIFFIGLKHQQEGMVDSACLSILVAIWITPSVLVHLLGQHLERRYSLFELREEKAEAKGGKDAPAKGGKSTL